MKWDLAGLEHLFEHIKYFEKVSRNHKSVVMVDFLWKHVFFMFQSKFGITDISYTPNKKITYGYSDRADEDGNILTYPVRMFYADATNESTWFYYSFDVYEDIYLNDYIYYLSDGVFYKTVLLDSEKETMIQQISDELGICALEAEEELDALLNTIKYLKKKLNAEGRPVVKRFLKSLPAEKQSEMLKMYMESLAYSEVDSETECVESVDYLINESLSAYLEFAKNNMGKIKQMFFKEHCFLLKLIRQIRESLPSDLSDLIESKEVFGFFFRYNKYDSGDSIGPLWEKNCRQIGASLSYCMWMVDVLLKEAGEKFDEIEISFQKRNGIYEVKGGI